MANGLWNDPDVPKNGWYCVGVDDLGPDERQTCEMCQVQTIRYVHTMEHLEYFTALAVGCICAGNMEGDIEAAKDRERNLKNTTARRLRAAEKLARAVADERFDFVGRGRAILGYGSWWLSRKGNPTTRFGGYRVVLLPGEKGWRVSINPPRCPGEWIAGRRLFPSIAEAKRGAYAGIDYLTRRALENSKN